MSLIEVDGYRPAHLSYSTISTYRMCGKKFQLEKVFQIEQRPGLAALGGKAVHVASERIDELIYEQGWDALEEDQSSVPPF